MNSRTRETPEQKPGVSCCTPNFSGKLSRGLVIALFLNAGIGAAEKPVAIPPSGVSVLTNVAPSPDSSPGDEAKVTKFFREKWEADLNAEITNLAKALQLSEAAVENLRSAHQKLTEPLLPEATALFAKQIQPFLNAPQQVAGALMLEWSAQMPGERNLILFNPLCGKEWTGILEKALSDAQKELWKARQDKDKKGAENDWDARRDMYTMMLLRTLNPQLHAAEYLLDLTPEKSGELRRLTQEIQESFLAELRENTVRLVLALRVPKEQILNGMFVPFRRGSGLREAFRIPLARLREKMKGILTAEEFQKLEEAGSVFQKEAVPLIARMILLRVGEGSGATLEQVSELQAPFEKSLQRFFSAQYGRGGESLNFEPPDQLMYRADNLAGTEIPEAELQGVLDPAQIRRWQKCFSRGNREQPANPAPRGRPQQGGPQGEEEMEALISEHLADQFEKRMLFLREPMEIRIEYWGRLLQLPGETLQVLRTAARGVLETRMGREFRSKQERDWRAALARTQSASKSTAPVNLPQLPVPQLGKLEEQPLWKETLEKVLTPQQREIIEQSEQRYREERLAAAMQIQALILSEQIGLKKSQMAACVRLMREVVSDFGVELAQTMPADHPPELRHVRPVPGFHLGPFSIFLLLHCADEGKLRALLTPRQWETLSQHRFTEQTKAQANSLRTLRENRLKPKDPPR